VNSKKLGRAWGAALVFCIFLVKPSGVGAASIYPVGLSSYIEACTGTTLAGCQTFSFVSDGQLITASGSKGPANDTVTFDAAAQASFGELKSRVTATYDVSGTPSRAYAEAGATSKEELTISNAAFDGQQGLLQIGFLFDGTVSDVVGAGTNRASILISTCLIPGGCNALNDTHQQLSTSVSKTAFQFNSPTLFPFVYGQPFGLRLDFFIDVGQRNTGLGAGGASVDYFHTVLLSLLTPMTATGQVVTGSTFRSGSGTAYGSTGVIPEPASMLLLGCGSIGVLIALRRQRRHSR